MNPVLTITFIYYYGSRDIIKTFIQKKYSTIELNFHEMSLKIHNLIDHPDFNIIKRSTP